MKASDATSLDSSGTRRSAPSPQGRANSYNFVPERDHPRARGAPCPLRAGGHAARDGGRALYLRLKDRMRLVRATTGDFSDEELAATRDALGQVYADVSSKLAPDDFATDLRKLRPSDECGACPEQDGCPGCWEAVPEDVFGRDDARVKAILAGLSGRVLDVGGGEAPYFDVLAPRGPAIEYVCVDPDAARLAVLATRWPSARFVVGVAEEMPEDLGAFDHVLFLRSYNHLHDPARALARALARLRPGGSLMLVDNVAFGLVRSARHAERAERAPENRLEHHRNDGAAEADRTVQTTAAAVRPDLRLVERCDVGPHTSNQWMLRYR